MKKSVYDCKALIGVLILCFVCLIVALVSIPQIGSASTKEPSAKSPGALQEEGSSIRQPDAISQPDIPPEESGNEPTNAACVDFRYIYRGFTLVSLDDRSTFEDFSEFGSKIILNENDWDNFMASYCPGIMYFESWDFSRDYLIASICMGAKPMCAISNEIASIMQENGLLKITYDDDPTNYIYALNTDAYTHFYMDVIAISRENLPENADDWTYHP